MGFLSIPQTNRYTKAALILHFPLESLAKEHQHDPARDRQRRRHPMRPIDAENKRIIRARKRQRDYERCLRGNRIPHPCLDGFEDEHADGGYSYPCCRCGQMTDIMCAPHEFDPDNHYCGRIPSCCP